MPVRHPGVDSGQQRESSQTTSIRCTRREKAHRGWANYTSDWLGEEDSNPRLLIQSQLSYH